MDTNLSHCLCRVHTDINMLPRKQIYKRENIITQLSNNLFAEIGTISRRYSKKLLLYLEHLAFSKDISRVQQKELEGIIGSCIYYEDKRRKRIGASTSWLL